MALVTTTSLWDSFDRKQLPLDVTEVSTTEEPSRIIKQVYFNGIQTDDGCIRVFAKFMINKHGNGCGVVLMNDLENVFDETFSDLLMEYGYNVLVIDYAGKTDGQLYTLYPYSLRKCNYHLYPETLYSLSDESRDSMTRVRRTCWIVWAAMMMRGITFLESREEIFRRKINVMGVKTGAFQVWKAAYLCRELGCGVALFNSGYLKDLKLEGVDEILYDTCIDNIPYAQESEVPVLIETASNADDDSSNYMSDLFLTIKSKKCRFSIGERRSKLLSDDQVNNVKIFLDYYNLGKYSLPGMPELTVRESERTLYYDLTVDLSLPIESVRMFVSQGNMPSSHRNWHEQAMTPISDGAYMAKVDVYAPKEQVSAFIIARYKNSLSVSSEVINNTPYLMKIKPSPIMKSRLVYDASSGVDDWTVLGNAESKNTDRPVIEEGLYGIAGITSKNGSLTTFKFGELRYKMEGQTMMQMTVFFESNNAMDFTVERKINHKKPGSDEIEWIEFAKYYYHVEVNAYKEWLKVNLSAESFRGPSGRLETFDDVVSLTINSDDKILINSIIWV